MPRGNRQYLQRYADEALNDLERAMEKVGNLRTAYQTGELPREMTTEQLESVPDDVENAKYPQYVTAMENIGLIIAQAHDFLKTMRESVM